MDTSIDKIAFNKASPGSQRARFTPLTLFTAAFSAATLGAALLSGIISLNTPYAGADIIREGGSWKVQKVYWAGLAAETGIAKGDKVITVNGQSPSAIPADTVFIRSKRIESLATESSTGAIRVVAIKDPIPARTQIELAGLSLLMFVYWLTSVVVIAKANSLRPVLILSLFCSLMVMVLGGVAASGRNYPGSFELQILAIVFAPWTFAHFVTLFVSPRPFSSHIRAWEPGIYVFPGLLAAGFLLLGREEGLFYPWFRNLLLIDMVGGAAIGAWLLASGYRKLPAVNKPQVRVAVIGSIASVMPFLALSVVPELLTGQEIVPATISILVTALVPGSLVYVILKHQLFDIDLLLRRGLVYGTLTALIMLLYGVIILLAGILSARLGLAQDWLSLILTVVVAWTALLAFDTLRKRLNELVDHYIYHDRYEYGDAVEATSQVMATPFNVEQLASYLTDFASITLGLSEAYLIRRDTKGEGWIKARAGPQAQETLDSLRVKHVLEPPAMTLFPRKALDITGFVYLLKLECGDRDLGTLALGRKSSGVNYSSKDLAFLATFQNLASLALERAALADDVQAKSFQLELNLKTLEWSANQMVAAHQALREAYVSIGQALVSIMESRDLLTAGHSQRVALVSQHLGMRLGLTEDKLQILVRAAQLHDIGRIVIPDSILLKRGPLTEAERVIVNAHPLKSGEILKPLEFLQEEVRVIEAHHERLDGKGYPYTLSGEQIPLLARILAVADAYDAMDSSRHYRPESFGYGEIVSEFRQGAGTQWDPKVVEAMLALLQEQHYPRNS